MKCVFCDIVRGTAAAEVVYRDEETVAFLDARPLFPGHTLIVPQEHYETMQDLPEPLTCRLFSLARRFSRAMETALRAEGSFVAVNNRVSQSVPHLHVHVVPRTKGDGLKGFFWPRRKYESDEQMAEVARLLRSAVCETGSQ